MNTVCRALVLCLVAGVVAAAQDTRIALGGFSGALGNTVNADHAQGYRESGSSMAFTVTLMTQPAVSRTTNVYIRANAATMGGGKPVSDITWRRNDIPDTPGAWNALTTSDVLIQSATLVGNGASWMNRLWFRVAVDWVADPPAAYSVGITITLMVTAP